MAILNAGRRPNAWLRQWQRLSDNVNQVIVIGCITCVVAMLTISFIGFFYMIITGDALSWTYSLARLFIPWIGMLSITVAFRAGEHVAMASLVQCFPAVVQKLLGIVNLLLIAIFGLMLIWYGLEFFINSNQYYLVSDQFQVHHRWVVACVPITGVILLIHLVNGSQFLNSQHAAPDIESLLTD
jgi:TRAP-type C4-dicarboxylate transport system permease small subunit